MSEKLQFQTNVAIDVALKYNDGKEVTGQTVIKSSIRSPMAASCMSHPSSRKRLTSSESDVANCLRSRRRRRRTEHGAPSSGWLRQTEVEIETLRGGLSNRTAKRRLSAAG